MSEQILIGKVLALWRDLLSPARDFTEERADWPTRHRIGKRNVR
jgi:hypothetical protein